MRTITINGKNYTIEYGQNAVCALEDVVHMPLSEIIDTISKGGVNMRLIRALFWAGLLSHNRGLSLERAGDILDQAGSNFKAVYSAVGEELIDSFVMQIIPVDEQPKEDDAKNIEGTV